MADRTSYDDLQRRIEELERENKRLKDEYDDELAQLYEMSVDMICIADISSAMFLKVNPAFTETLGYSEEELLGRPFTDFVHPDDVESTLSVAREELKEGKKVINFENRYRCNDGTYIWLSWVSHPVPDKGISYAIAREVTKRKAFDIQQSKIQLELIKRNRFIETILHHFPIGLGINEIDTGRVTYLNKKWEDIYGWPKEDFPTVEAFFEKVFPEPETRELLKDRIVKDISSGDPDRMAWEDLEITTKNGEKRIVYAKNIPLMDQNVMISTVQDFTEKRKLEAQVRQSQKIEAIGILAGGIAHDFNNLLAIITGNVSYALSVCEEGEELIDILSDVLDGAKQAQSLTNQLLTFAKGGEPIKKIHDIRPIVEEAALFVTRGASSKCEFRMADNLWHTEVDSGQINQVVANLVINADQAQPQGGIITIKAENARIKYAAGLNLTDGDYIKVSVEDRGVGISEKFIHNIFDPYFTTKQKGSGLGLASSYSIVKKHGGHLTVYSEIGQGTVFTMYLPAVLSETFIMDDKKEQKHRGQGRILIMDDMDAVLRMVGKILERMGYDTEGVTDGEKAIEAYRKAYDNGRPFDLVIVDLTVPGGMGGEETITELLKIDPHVKAAVSSGYSNDPIMANYRDYGFSGVVPKPYTKEQLAELLNHIIEN